MYRQEYRWPTHVGVDTAPFSPSAESISRCASDWQTCLAMADGRGPAGSGRWVVVVADPVPTADGPVHAPPARATTPIRISSRPRTGRQYQFTHEIPGQQVGPPHQEAPGRPRAPRARSWGTDRRPAANRGSSLRPGPP